MTNRYTQINDYYLKDTYTGKKITLTQACLLLNKYETELNKQKKETSCPVQQ